MADRNGMHGRKISLLLLHSGLLLVVIGALISWRTARTDRAFLRPGEPLTLYGMTFEHRGDGELYVDGVEAGLQPFRPVIAREWRVQYLDSMPDGTLAIQLRSDRYGQALVFAGYALFALGSIGVIGLLPLLAVGGAILAISFFRPSSPALSSGWFAVHVGLIAAAYLCFLILPWKPSAKTLARGVCLLGLGIAAGSVWGSSAWGRYWGWDPKETGALALFLLYCLPLHFKKLSRREFYILPLAIILILLILPGLHSYLF